MLRKAYLLAKIGADTAENEQHFAENLPIGRRVADRCPGPELSRRAELERFTARTGGPVGQLPILGKFSANFRSFSAVSASIFASKDAFNGFAAFFKINQII